MEYKKYSLTGFAEDAASSKPTPGGGGVSAYVGALGISLGNMVGELTVGKKKYKEVEQDILELMQKAKHMQNELLELIDADAQCFHPLAKAYSIPKDDPSRQVIMEEALQTACTAPMDIMRACATCIELIDGFAQMGSKLALSDAGCAAIIAKAAMQAAVLNVYINAKSMKDRKYATALVREADQLLLEYCDKADIIYQKVLEEIK
ncbi:cyclodeaminase/cyclohydrolase family protein [Eubacterium oxidoreducens]|nr:cyclodeaminase/cyclohydrolase family protein [Eubacterium oxidoreducens]